MTNFQSYKIKIDIIKNKLNRPGKSEITKIVLLIFLVLFMLSVYHAANAKDINLDKLDSEFQKSTKITKSMAKCNNRQLMQFMNLDYSVYDSYLYYKSTEALGVSELLIVKVKSTDQISSVQDAVDDRIKNQIRTFDGYGPAQVELLKNAVVYKRGKYVFYCVNKSPDKYLEVLKHDIQ